MSLVVGVIGLAGMAAILIGGTLRTYRRSGEPPVIFVLRRLDWLYCGLWLGMHQRGGCTIPDTGPALLISNHVSGIDGWLLQFACPNRVISFLIAREYYELPGLGWLFRAIEAIPVNRTGQEISATKAALRGLRDGKVIGIFPEGHIRLPGEPELAEVKPGAALLALRAKVPVVPAYIARARPIPNIIRGILTPMRTVVYYGAPIDLGVDRSAERHDRAAIEELTRRFQTALCDLAERARRDGWSREPGGTCGPRDRAGQGPAPRPLSA